MNKKNRIIDLVLLMVVIYLAAIVRNSKVGVLFDYKVLNILHKSTNNLILNISKIISFLGSYNAIGISMILLFIYFRKSRRKNDFIFILFNSLGVSVINYIIKIIVNRTRPIDYFRIEYSGLSFPSGHSMVNMSFILAILFIFNKDNKKYINILGYLYILCMGLSRLYLGVHWPTDVLAGFILGYILFKYSKEYIKDKQLV